VGDWLKEAEELHRTRNKNNHCPKHPPNMCPSGTGESPTGGPDTRTWEQDSWGAEKWRGSDGSHAFMTGTGILFPAGRSTSALMRSAHVTASSTSCPTSSSGLPVLGSAGGYGAY
jgi:hypothetical protein